MYNLDGYIAGFYTYSYLPEVIAAYDPHSARNRMRKRIRKQEQGANNSVGWREKRNSKCEGEEETNL